MRVTSAYLDFNTQIGFCVWVGSKRNAVAVRLSGADGCVHRPRYPFKRKVKAKRLLHTWVRTRHRLR